MLPGFLVSTAARFVCVFTIGLFLLIGTETEGLLNIFGSSDVAALLVTLKLDAFAPSPFKQQNTNKIPKIMPKPTLEIYLLPGFLVGTAASLVSGILIIKLMQKICNHVRLSYFAYYCWVAGVLFIILTMIF